MGNETTAERCQQCGESTEADGAFHIETRRGRETVVCLSCYEDYMDEALFGPSYDYREDW